MLLKGILRKKGIIFYNERMVTINEAGVLNYYHFDKPELPKASIDLKSSMVLSVRLTYCGAQSTKASQNRPTPHVDDEVRISLRNREEFVFRTSKLQQSRGGPSIEKWEKTIRKFTNNVKVNF